MLVVSRIPSQDYHEIYNKLLIGEDIVVRVFEIRNGRVRIGIEAPANIEIVRAELVEDDER